MAKSKKSELSSFQHYDKLTDAVAAIQAHLKTLPKHFIVELTSCHTGGYNVNCVENSPKE